MNRTKMIEPAGGMDGMERQAPPVESPSIAGTAASKNGAVTDGRMDDQAHPYLRLFSEAMTTGTENRKDLLVERLAGLVNDRDKSSEKTSGTSIQIRDAVKVAAPNDKIPLVDLQELPRASVEERPATLRTTVLQGADGSRERIDAVLIGNGAGFGTGQGEENRNMSMQDEANDWTGSTESEGMKSFYRSAVNGSGTEGTQATSENLRSMDLLSQIQEARSILMRDFGRVRIALNPPSLGNLDLEIMVRRNRVEVVIRVDNLLVQQTLQANADELKTSLQGQGLHIEGLSILNSGTADRQDYAFSNNGSLQRDDQDWRNAGRNDGEEEEAPLSPFMERSPGRYDSSSGTISLFV
ncbi:MAG: flagellar hook-length control protein FliK [Deltaproteobacteria bacterium]|nr:flagellar hook-length control protein FliK [Deltaproteobacteria bacterium]